MKLPYSDPDPAGVERATKAKRLRDLATETARLRPQALTRANGEEADHDGKYPANFTKGLKHDKCGLVEHPEDYRCFVEAINSPDPTLFEKSVYSAADHEADPEKLYNCHFTKTCDKSKEKSKPNWRGWESPRAGHVYELQGPDAGEVGMAPAPRVGSSELAAEMAEVYALAILRDVRFTDICAGGSARFCGCDKKPANAKLSAKEITKLLNGMPFYKASAHHPAKSSTPHNIDESGLNGFERNRRSARTLLAKDGKLTEQTLFRGSTKGAQTGPYISQFMLIGAGSLACGGDGKSGYPGKDASFDPEDGFIPYGSLIIDQRTLSHKNCLDYMTDWCSWLDVQNGANVKGADQFESERRFITTPRDLATYVHFDALYEAYLNAALIMQGLGIPASKGFPEPSPSTRRDAFATYGGPHILSLVCEVATRCLKAVRRQKFNYHRRARPEVMGGRFTLTKMLWDKNCKPTKELVDKLGCSADAFASSLSEIPPQLRDAVIEHNAHQNTLKRNIHCKGPCFDEKKWNEKFPDCNLLLPMAFPEGSPMHPAYGAGHATVAGGCVTMLKAFFEMFEDCNSYEERKLPFCLVPDGQGHHLVQDKKYKQPLTVQGELDKLAANISIGRNMAGVHYYSDYYDSLRMGERIAIGIMMEQAPTYGDYMEMTFKSYDGDYITISGEGGSAASLSIMGSDGSPVSQRDWWLRHVSGEEIHVDL